VTRDGPVFRMTAPVRRARIRTNVTSFRGKRMLRPPHAASLAIALAAALFAVSWAAAAPGDPAAILEELEASKLDPSAAVEVRNLRLDTGLAKLRIREGRLYPATPVAGRPVEFVLIGDAVLEIDPPDPVEADQLRRFTGRTNLREPIRRAVLVVCMDAAADALANRDRVAEPDPAEIASAREAFDAWRAGSERRIVAARAAVLQDALGDPYYATYFAGRFESEELGTFLYLVEPDAREQVTLGQFVRPDLTDKERKRSQKWFDRAQRRGRMVGLEVDDLGTFDNWLSTTLRGPAGEPAPGVAAFEPVHYALDVRVDGKDGRVDGSAELRLRATTGSRKVVLLEMDSDLAVARVTGGDGADLPFVQERGDTYVVLADAPAQGAEVVVRVDYGGAILDKLPVADKLFALSNTTGWYPHAGDVDRATYELTLRWPKRLDLVASGKLVDEGEEDGERWMRRRLDVPASAVSFELGRYEFEEFRVGAIDVRVALDHVSQDVPLAVRREVVDTVRDVLEYYQEAFGPYPLDHLQVTTAPRSFSQGLLGFVTLSLVHMGDYDVRMVLAGIDDRRSVLAHEIAHQWWGGVVGWRDYRDQWLSEAMANYATLMWIENRLPAERRPALTPISSWKQILTYTTPDGRTIEQLGPVVLGARLESSDADGAYDAVVYRKGAVVLAMLAQNFDDGPFLQAHRQLCEAVRFREISTDEYFAALEKMFGTDLGWFKRQFIYGTGLPEVYYDYAVVPPVDGGKWTVKARLQQQTPYRFRDKVVTLDDGRLDVRLEAEPEIDTSDFALVIPVSIGFHDPSVDGESKKKGRNGKNGPTPNRWLTGRIRLQGETHEFEIPVEFEPLDFRLDRKEAVFGRFFSEAREPKRMTYFRGLDAVHAGRAAEAEALFRRALEAEYLVAAPGDSFDEFFRERDRKHLDYAIRRELARLLLDENRLDEAAATLEEIRKGVGSSTTGKNDPAYRFLEARLALLRGDAEEAFRLLDRTLAKRRGMDRVQGSLLLAIAARRLGRTDAMREAIDYAKERGAELGPLAAEARPAGDPGAR